eukprot:scaffold2903_cov170-Amphora_coffeaeformis.AAC.15
MAETTQMAEAEAAAAALEQWTSPRVGGTSGDPPPTTPAYNRRQTVAEPFQYERSPVEWMQRQSLMMVFNNEDDDEYMMEEDDEQEESLSFRPSSTIAGSGQTPRSIRVATPRVLERADTPVMSNSSKKTTAATPSSFASVNNQSPAVYNPYYATTPEAGTTATPASRCSATTANAGATPRWMQRATPLSRAAVQECRLYHQALVIFRQEKRRLSLLRDDDGMNNGEEIYNQHLEDKDDDADTSAAIVDADFFQALAAACYARAPAPGNKEDDNDPLAKNPMKHMDRKEGNFWSLLRHLRKIGVEALLLPPSMDARDEIRRYIATQARRVTATPLELVGYSSASSRNSSHLLGQRHATWNAKKNNDSSNVPPMVMQRWKVFLEWLEECHNRCLPSTVARPRPGKSASQMVDDCLITSSRQTEVVRAALNLILAGRLEDAIRMAADSGLEYLAAQWSGGVPAGKIVNDNTNTTSQVGNPRRAMWQVFMWKKAQLAAESKTAAVKDESAIAALLSNHEKAALAHPVLRTWERSLYVMTKAVVGRWEDDLLHQHNNYRRQERPPYPGTEYEAYEQEHLQETAAVQDLTESRLITELVATPFEEQRDDDPYSAAMTAFWVGQHSVQAYMNAWRQNVEEYDTAYVRFLAHLALYLDSLAESGAQIDLPGVTEWKNGIVKEYLNQLASREELWHMMVLYASFLPSQEILQSLPTLLMQMESQPARQELLHQMNTFLEPGLDRAIVLAIAEITLEEVEFDENLFLPSVLDNRKMRVVSWFSIRSELVPDGLIYSNKLLRQFVLADKLTAANQFVRDVCPEEIKEFYEDDPLDQTQDDTRVAVDADGNAIMATVDAVAMVDHFREVRKEHAALLAYLDAEIAVDAWKGVLANAEAEPAQVDDRIDKSHLNEEEVKIAVSQERRQLADEKRSISRKLSLAASRALEKLAKVIKFSGGWLHEEEQEGEMLSGEEQTRRQELNQLRSKVIPSVILRYREICTDTAAWMSSSLYDGIKKLEKDAAAVVSDLDRSNPPDQSSFAPAYWTQQCLFLMDAISTETYLCLAAMTKEQRHDILSIMTETMVTHLKYTSAWA